MVVAAAGAASLYPRCAMWLPPSVTCVSSLPGGSRASLRWAGQAQVQEGRHHGTMLVVIIQLMFDDDCVDAEYSITYKVYKGSIKTVKLYKE